MGNANQVGTKITKGDHRPWTEKWWTVRQCLDTLRETYSGGAHGLGNVEIDGQVNTFFVECDTLHDWLKGDIASLPGISKANIDKHVSQSDPLTTCKDLCNTHKHHTRTSGTTARIRDTEVTPTGEVRVTIEIDWASRAATTVDALDLANDCIKSWRAFFKRFGVTEP